MKRFAALFLSLTLLLALAGCGADDSAAASGISGQPVQNSSAGGDYASASLPEGGESFDTSASLPDPEPEEVTPDLPVEGEYYYDLEDVVLYLDTYGELPENFITKDEARDLGWSGGSVERYMDGAAIGGDHFGNREGNLPEGNYTECDLNTDDQNSRGAERLVFDEDGNYYYTDDHYETFTQVWVENGEVVW